MSGAESIATGGGDYAEGGIDSRRGTFAEAVTETHTEYNSVDPQIVRLLERLVDKRTSDEAKTEATIRMLDRMGGALGRFELILLAVLVSQVILILVLVLVLGAVIVPALRGTSGAALATLAAALWYGGRMT